MAVAPARRRAGSRRITAGGAPAAALLWTLAAPAALAAQGRVVHATMLADLTGETGPARVTVEYRLAGVDPERGVPVSVLGVGGSDVEEVWVEGGPVSLPLVRGRYREGVVPVAPTAGAPAPAGETVLRLSYSVLHPVAGARSPVAHLPVVSVAWPPREALPGTFAADVRVPPGWRVVESFPTGLAPTSRVGTLRVELPVVPSVVTVRARVGPGGGPGLALVLDLLAGAVIVGFSAVGWRFLRGAST